MSDEIARMVLARDAALLSLDEARIRGYAKKYGAEVSDNPLVFWASVHKARLAILNCPEDARETSRQWLREYGFRDVSVWEPRSSNGG